MVKPNLLFDNLSLNLKEDTIHQLKKIVDEGKPKDIEDIVSLIKDKYSNISMKSGLYRQDMQASSSDFNKQFSEFEKDIIKLYVAFDKLNKLLERNDRKKQSEINKLKNKLKEYKIELKNQEALLIENEGFSSLIYENLETDARLEEHLPSLFIDPKTEKYVSKENKAYYDTIFNNLKSSTFHQSNLEISSCNIVKQTASEFIDTANDYNPIENLEIKDFNRPWDETLLVPDKIDMTYDDHLFKNCEENKNFRGGALCKIRIDLPSPLSVSNIQIDPYSYYPFEILKVVAFPSETSRELFYDNENYDKAKAISNVQEIIGPESFNQIQGPVIMDEKKEFNFVGIEEISIIEISLRQRNYKEKNYRIDNRNYFAAQTINDFFEINEPAFNIQDANVNSIEDLDYYNENYKIDRVENLLQKTLTNYEIFENQSDKIIQVLSEEIPYFNKDYFSKYLNDKSTVVDEQYISEYQNKMFEYHYGIKNISLNYNAYSDLSMSISTLRDADINIKDVALDVEDSIVNHDNYLNDKYVIEYYITNRENPSSDQWYPIIPHNYRKFCKNKTRYKEVIVQRRDDEGEMVSSPLTFKANPRDSVEVKKANGDTVEAFISDDGKYVVLDKQYQQFANQSQELTEDLTVEYTIHDNINPFFVDLKEESSPITYIGEDNRPGELFEEVNTNNTIELSNHPYIDRKKVNIEQLDPQKLNFEDENMKFLNPNAYRYNPNYKKDSEGYRPVVVECEGNVEVYNTVRETSETIETVIYNDIEGVPFEFSYTIEEDNNIIRKTASRYDDMISANLVVPYFYNQTNYNSDEIPALKQYDPKEYPVFEYYHNGKNIYLNDSFDGNSSNTNANIRVHYRYLTEGIRVMAIIRQIKNIPEITPIIHGYTVKCRSL